MYAAMLDKKLVLAVSEAYLVNSRQKKLNQEIYRCPHCNKKVILIVSEKKSAFFKHLTSYTNLMGEKEEHHQSKLLFKAALTAAGFDAAVEIPLADGQLRADVLVAENLAFEIQCAPLSDAEFKHRHSLYQKIGVTDIWVVGQLHYLKHSLKHTQLIFFRRNKRWGNYYLEVNPAKNCFCLKFNVLQEAVTKKLRYQTKYFVLDEIGIRQFWNFRPNLKKYVGNPVNQRKYVQRQIKQKSKLGLKVAELLYQQKLSLEDLPNSIFIKYRNPGDENVLINYLQKKRLN